jgi:hypothetical protein
MTHDVHRDESGYYLETYGGGRYTAIGWTADQAEAEEWLRAVRGRGAWSGMPPRIRVAERRGLLS